LPFIPLKSKFNCAVDKPSDAATGLPFVSVAYAPIDLNPLAILLFANLSPIF